MSAILHLHQWECQQIYTKRFKYFSRLDIKLENQIICAARSDRLFKLSGNCPSELDRPIRNPPNVPLKMHSNVLLLSSVCALQAFAATIKVDVGNGGLKFNPATITAASGDMVEFVYYPKAWPSSILALARGSIGTDEFLLESLRRSS